MGLRLTLANILVSVRKAPGDFALSARLNRESLTMLPPSMDNQRYRINSDLSGTVSLLAQEGGALEPGAEVTVSGLKARPDLNGAAGTIVVWYPDRGRYAVKVGDGSEEVALKPINVGQTDETFNEAYLARVREATDIAKSLDPDAAGQEERYPNELKELKTEALRKAYDAIDAFTKWCTNSAGENFTEAAAAERYVKVQDDERFSGLKIEICEVLDGAEFEPGMRVQARFNWGAALCRAGRIEEGKERYEQALEMLNSPAASGAERLREAILGSITLCDKQISGEYPNLEQILGAAYHGSGR